MNITKTIEDFLERLSLSPSKTLFDSFIKHSKKIVIVITTFWLGVILLLGWLAAKKIREVVVEDFNQQQLVLAKHTANQIETSLNALKRELSLLSFSPSIQYPESLFTMKRLEIAFSRIKDEGGIEIRFIENKGLASYVVNSDGYNTQQSHPEDNDYLKWARQEKNKDSILTTDVSHMPYGNTSHNVLIIKMVLPVWESTNKLSGALIFAVDASTLIKNITKEIRSGKTGYAWVIDNKGIFLYHPETEFEGKNAFEARKEKKPTISFTRINEIQKEMMLTGKVGTSWYISGWHRGMAEGEIKKLIAYAPVSLNNKSEKRFWSVAIVAPISEVAGTIHKIQIRQFLLEGVFVMAILFGGLVMRGVMARWSSSLQEEVDSKTRELRKSENQYRFLIENANDFIFTVNSDGSITSINQAGCSFFKKTREEIIGSNIGEICFNEESASIQFQAIEDVFNTKLSKQITYTVNINGNEYWLSTNLSGLLDEKGDVFAVLGIARDITQIKKMEDQMLHTEKLASMGTLAAGVAHEINNPLAVILGFTDLLLEKVPATSEFHDILKTVEKQGTNAKRVVENLLSFARYTEYKEEDVDINKNIETVLTIVGNSISINKIAVNRNMMELLPMVKGDKGELQQVFFNIINNAVYFMEGGGILTIVTRAIDEEGQHIEIRISDTGPGIKKEYRTRIFDPLFTTKKVGEGTGLGLSVSYGIISKHGGTITFETKTKVEIDSIRNESEETGTTFIITLPAAKNVEG